jgi:hypothetical protein
MITDTIKQTLRRTGGRSSFAECSPRLDPHSHEAFDSVAVFALVIAIWALVGGITEIVHSIDLEAVLPSGGCSCSAVDQRRLRRRRLYYYPGLSLAFAVTWVSHGVQRSWESRWPFRRRGGLSVGWTLTWAS